VLAGSYLAELDEPSPWGPTGDCLVLFIADGSAAPTCLTDPEVVSFHSATGHWCLLGTDPSSGRAFYTRFDHTPPFTCEPASAS
jgi:hypothetical protein